MVELKLTELPDGNISCEMDGSNAEIASMICKAMIRNVDIASIVCGAIPTFLDENKIDRAGYCKTVMDAQGNTKDK